MPAYDVIIRGATCVSHRGIGPADVGVREGRTAAIGDLSKADAGEVIDARGLHLLPGVIDTQVHFREPGNEHKEDLETGSRSAVLGGVTAVFEMPNTNPSTTTAERIADKVARGTGRMWCDFAFFAGAAAENVTELPALERLPGCCGVKLFMGSSTGSLLVSEDETILKVLQNGRRRVAVHAEDEARLNARKGERVAGDPRSHPIWRDEETALLATTRVLKLARQAGRRVHVLHVTTAEEMELLAKNKDIATVEVTPQHLTLAAPECYEALGTYAQMNPPIREGRHREALWRALQAGIVDVIGSDHAPHTKEEKAKTYPDTPSGMPGVQTLLPLMLDHVAEGKLSLQHMVDLTSASPARIYGIASKGRLAVGYDADYTLVDLKAHVTIENAWLASRCGWSPFEGRKIKGFPRGTIIRGRQVMWDGALAEKADGQPMRFVETL
jgi:dihydroorotase